jgi:hypothetical protein
MISKYFLDDRYFILLKLWKLWLVK